MARQPYDESVILMSDSGTEIDRTPQLTDEYDDNCAWSRYPDGSSEWAFMKSSRGAEATGCFCQDNWLSCCFEENDNVSGALLDSCLEEHDAKSLWNVSCMSLERRYNNCSLEEDLGEIYDDEVPKYPKICVRLEENRSSMIPNLEFVMGQEISGEGNVSGRGFVNVANKYYIPTEGDLDTELKTRERGSGLYESEEQIRLLRKNNSIEISCYNCIRGRIDDD